MPAPGKIAVVSGGSSGIGRAIVSHLHREGWTVHACGRGEAALGKLAVEFPGVRTMVCDVSDRAAVRRFAQKVLGETPAVDLLVSNAGGLREIDFTSDSLAETDLTSELRINTEGAIHLVAEFVPGLRRAKESSILIVGSGYGLAPATRAPIYSASKAALHSLAKSLRRQFEPLGISVTELLPPVVDTPAVVHRAVPKLRPDDVARAALSGAAAGEEEVRPGQTKYLPLLLRLMPRLGERIVAKT